MTYHEIVTTGADGYPVSCTGDVLVGDHVRWAEAVFARRDGRPEFAGERTIEAEVVGEQVEDGRRMLDLRVLAADGFEPPAPRKAIRRAAHNIYRNGCYRKLWADEAARGEVVATAAERRAAEGPRSARRDRGVRMIEIEAEDWERIGERARRAGVTESVYVVAKALNEPLWRAGRRGS